MNRAPNVEAMSPKDKALWDLWGLIMRHFDEDGEAEGLIDDEIQKLGYRKVTTCEKCAWWKPRKPDGGKRVGYCTLVGWEPSLYPEWHYCSEGEPKEGVND